MKKEKLKSVLYKYTEYKYAKEMVTNGSFRIGTLYEYRNIEKYNNKILDENEGIKKIYSIDDIDCRDPESIPFHIKDKLTPKNKKANNVFKNIKFRTTYTHPNCYIICLSEVFNKELIKDFDKNCNTIVEIKNPLFFFEDLTNSISLIKKIINFRVGSCVYFNREIEYRGCPPINYQH